MRAFPKHFRTLVCKASCSHVRSCAVPILYREMRDPRLVNKQHTGQLSSDHAVARYAIIACLGGIAGLGTSRIDAAESRHPGQACTSTTGHGSDTSSHLLKTQNHVFTTAKRAGIIEWPSQRPQIRSFLALRSGRSRQTRGGLPSGARSGNSWVLGLPPPREAKISPGQMRMVHASPASTSSFCPGETLLLRCTAVLLPFCCCSVEPRLYV